MILLALRSDVGAPARSGAEEGARVRVTGGLPLQLASVQRQQGPINAVKGSRRNTFRGDKWRGAMSLPLSLFIVAFKGRAVVKLRTSEDP